jgi:hypothetical protein
LRHFVGDYILFASVCRILVVSTLIIVLFAGCQRTERLLIESPGKVNHSVFLGKTRDFSLKFINSVEKTPVIENFHVREDGKLILISSLYRSHGVGLPSLPEEGRLTISADGWFLLENLHREFQDIRVRVGPEAKLILEYENKKYPLFEWYPPGSLVIIRREYHD